MQTSRVMPTKTKTQVPPQFPIFIPTKGRADSRLTIKALQSMGIEEWYAVVEPQEFAQYAAVIPTQHIICLPLSYKQSYRTLDELGLSKSTGPGPARNFIWDTAMQMGAGWHWVMDDNIRHFYRYHNNLKFEVLSGAFFRIMEDFCLRYANVAMAGPQYEMFVVRKQKRPPFLLNTRVYSCNLIRNDLPFRWRGRYNEDTILSLDLLKAGWCTVLFNTCCAQKIATQRVKGGNTRDFYEQEGTAPKSQMLVKVYPQYAKLSYRFKRIHHYVDYSQFKQQLKRKPGVIIPESPNEYGLELRHR